MSLRVFAVLAVLAFSAAHGMKLKLKKPDVTYCKDGSDQWFANIQVDVQPWPVHIAAGASLSLDGGVDILQTVEDGSRVALEMELKTVLGPLKIPCLEVHNLNLVNIEFSEHNVLLD